MAGKPNPAGLKIARGNPGKRDFNRNEPKPSGEVQKPSFVKAEAAKIWNSLAPDLIKQGILTAWDVHNFGLYCCLAAEAALEPRLFPAAKIGQLRALGGAFGVGDAKARAQIKVIAKEEKDPADEFYGA